MPRPSEIYKFNTYELPRRAGEMKEYELDLVLQEPVGIPLISVPTAATIEVDMRLESVTEGVLVSAQIFATAIGECTRCLDPIELDIDRSIQELYRYAPTNEKGGRRNKGGKKIDSDIDDLDNDDELEMEGDYIDLETPIRDAIVLELPINPLCRQDCPGLCPDCGGKWAELEADHLHEVIDVRWKGLAGLTLDSEPMSGDDFKI